MTSGPGSLIGGPALVDRLITPERHQLHTKRLGYGRAQHPALLFSNIWSTTSWLIALHLFRRLPKLLLCSNVTLE
jgi:hypothetical protein